MLQVTTKLKLETDTISDLYPRYADAWSTALHEAAARHLLSEDEFHDEMIDERLEKYLVLDEAGSVVAMTTLTTELAAIPWINPSFYRERFPDEHRRGSLFYLGYTFVDVDHRRSSALALMVDAINARIAAARGVIGFDICGFNVGHGIGRRLDRMFYRSAGSTTLDTQTYFVADYRSPRQAGNPHAYRITTLADRGDLLADVRALMADRWPPYMLVGQPAHGVDLDALLLELADHQVVLLDGQDAVRGAGFLVPVHWDGTVEALPDGWDAAISDAAALVRSGRLGTAWCALSITVSADRAGEGLAGRVLTAMRATAAAAGAHSLIAPIRPVRKADYPLIPFEEYVTWTNDTGEPFDPWTRLHCRLGGEVLGIAPSSMVITGSVAEWESWSDQALPASGRYTIAGGLAPLEVDRVADRGRYVEPNLWIRHRLDAEADQPT